jgi:uncharacterized protein (TIGR02599 family)
MSSISLSAAIRRGAFTLVELMAATAVFIGLMLLLVTATNQTGEIWRRSSSKIEQFQQARRGFEAMTRRISQATLNTYWDYHYPLTNGKPDRSKVPDGYIRQSELRIRSGQASTLLVSISDGVPRPTHAIFFQAPIGFVDDAEHSGTSLTPVQSSQTHKPLNNLLNTWGYYLEVNDDTTLLPRFLQNVVPGRTRSRLMEMMEPSETIKIDNPTSDPSNSTSTVPLDPNWDNPAYLGWFTGAVQRKTPVRVLAENVLALVILPRLTPQDEAARLIATPPKTDVLCPLYDYDSKRLSNSKSGIANPTQAGTDPELNPKNQLPPVITVAMVAIDETTAQRMGNPTTALKMATLFNDSTLMTDNPNTPAPDDGDLNKLETQLINLHANYRIFISNVAIRGAKWSRSQTN